MTTYTVISMQDGNEYWTGEAGDVFDAVRRSFTDAGSTAPDVEMTAYSSVPEVECEWFVRCDDAGSEHLSRWVASA